MRRHRLLWGAWATVWLGVALLPVWLALGPPSPEHDAGPSGEQGLLIVEMHPPPPPTL